MDSLPEVPNQPKDLQFPQRSFGKTKIVKRSFQPSWCDKWQWIHYNENEDSVLCFTCAQAATQKKVQWSTNADLAFISRGFYNWKDATVKFTQHAASKCHEESVLKVVTQPSTSKDIAESMSAQIAKERLERLQCFLKILSNIRFLARQGLPLRGHGDETDSNFFQLMKLRGEDDSRVAQWLRQSQTNNLFGVQRLKKIG